MAATVEVIVNAVDNFSSVLGNFGNIMTGIKSTIDLVTGAFDAAAGAIEPFVNSASESEVAISRLDTILQSTNGTIGLTSKQLQDMATILMDSTGFSDEDIMGAEGMLLRFENLNKNIFPEALSLTADLARSLGVDLTTAARQIGMALDDPAQGIGRLNTQFRLFNDEEMTTIKQMAENGQVAEAQALIMDRLREKVGGAADAYGNTFAGSLDIAREKLDNFRELIGGPIIYLLGQLLDKVTAFADTNPIIQSVIKFFTEFNDLLQTPDVPFLSALGAALLHIQGSTVLNDLGGVLLALQGNITMGMDPFTAIANGLETLSQKWQGTAIGSIVDRILEFMNTAQTEGIGVAFQDLLDDVWNTLTTDLPTKIQGLVNKISDGLSGSDFTSMTATFSRVLANVVVGAFNILTSTADTLVNQVDWRPLGEALRGAGDEIWEGFKQSGADKTLGDKFGPLFRDALYNGIIAELMSNPLVIIFESSMITGANMMQTGINIVSGIIEGIRISYYLMVAEIVTALAKMVLAVKQFLGIASPSTLFFGIGVSMVQGLIDGWKSLIGDFLDLISPFTDALGLTGTGSNVPYSPGGYGPGGYTPPTTGGGGIGGMGTVTNNYYFYGPAYLSGVGPEGTYDCPPNPIISGSSTLIPGGVR